MKKLVKTIHVVIGNGKEIECDTEAKAIETLEFITDFLNNKIGFKIEQRQKEEYEIEKGDKVHWINNNKVIESRTDEVIKIVKDMWGDTRYQTKQIDGDKRGIAYKKDLYLII